MNFIDKLIKNEGGNIRIITSFENNKPCWFVIKLNQAKYQEYKKANSKPTVNLKDYGEILESNWGFLTKEDKDKLTYKYNIK